MHRVCLGGTILIHAECEELWPDWMDAQADLSLRWTRKPFWWFCQLLASPCGVQELIIHLE